VRDAIPNMGNAGNKKVCDLFAIDKACSEPTIA
jgi:hypothetical protein